MVQGSQLSVRCTCGLIAIGVCTGCKAMQDASFQWFCNNFAYQHQPSAACAHSELGPLLLAACVQTPCHHHQLDCRSGLGSWMRCLLSCQLYPVWRTSCCQLEQQLLCQLKQPWGCPGRHQPLCGGFAWNSCKMKPIYAIVCGQATVKLRYT